MSTLFVDEDGAFIGFEKNRCYVRSQNGDRKELPVETVDGIAILGYAQLSTQAAQHFLKAGIPVAYYSKGGHYFGRLQSTNHVNARRQRKQAFLYQTPFSLNLSKKMIEAKINNQYVVLRRYEKDKNRECSEEASMLREIRDCIKEAASTEILMGYEGISARNYFMGLGKIIDSEFRFDGRNRQPPRDPFNCLISLGYTILMNELYGQIELKGMNPFFGILHTDQENHPTLASDLMEEWRPIIVDSVALSLINGHEITADAFYTSQENGACLLNRDGLGIFLNKMKNKFQTKINYIMEEDYPMSFRTAIEYQVNSFMKAIEEENVDLYNPVTIR